MKKGETDKDRDSRCRQREGSDHAGGDIGASRLVRMGSLKYDN